MVLFTSVRPLERAENLRAVYDAYDGPKEFVQRDYNHPIDGMHSGRYRLMVTDGLVEDSPGKYIWIGHGMGAGKTIGLQHPTCPFKGSSLVTYAIASSEEMIPVVAGFCGISEEQVIPLAMPRTDAYFGAQKTEAPYKRHLYAPTFRAGRWGPDLNMIWRLLPEGHRFIVKPHMVTGNRFRSVWQNVEVAIDPNAPAATRFAAAEMTNYLSRALGTAIPLVTVPTSGKYAIILGTNAWSRAVRLAPESLKRDSFCVKILPERAYIAGCDDPKLDIEKGLANGHVAARERATLFGVHEFLERHVGLRFYFPGELGTVVPRATALLLHPGRGTVSRHRSEGPCRAGPRQGAVPPVPARRDGARDLLPRPEPLQHRRALQRVASRVLPAPQERDALRGHEV